MYHDILFINKHIVWRSIYVPYIFHLRNSEIYRGEGFMVMVFKATFKNISVLLVEETGVSEKTTDLSQVPCKRCIENTFLERDFNSQL